MATIYDYNYRALKAGAVGTFTKEEWVGLCAAYDNRCIACGLARPLTPDHVIPIVMGGGNSIDNLQPMCRSCNCSKKELTIDFRAAPFPGIGWQRQYMKGV
jgi:5-methylcytosine-specific restriction endonuclease McrA